MQPSDLILIIPASGFSRRFGAQDKLTAQLGGRPLADYAAALGEAIGFSQKIAVVPNEDDPRARIFRRRGFELVINPAPERGQAYSIHCGAVAAFNTGGAEGPEEAPEEASEAALGLCILLADMPLLTQAHIRSLIAQAGGGVTKTAYQGHSQPPAIFCGRAAQAWRHTPLNAIADITPKLAALAEPYGDDIDTTEDLLRVEKYLQKQRS